MEAIANSLTLAAQFAFWGIWWPFVLLSMVVGPFGTQRFFAGSSRLRAVAHVGAFVCAAAGLLATLPMLCVAWLLFCAASFALFLRSHAGSLRSPRVSGLTKSMIVVEANELSAALRFDIAAARIAAVINPATPGGKCSQTKAG